MGAWSESAFVACQHCGRRYAASTVMRHEPLCIARPEQFAAVRAVLDAGDGRIKTIAAYNATRGHAPAPNTLYDIIGSTRWQDVATRFGLFFSMKRQPQTAIVPAPVMTPIVAAGYAAVPHEEDGIFVCGLPVCHLVDYGDRVGFVLR